MRLVISLDADLPDWIRKDNTKLPLSGNPTARKMAKQWRTYYGSDLAYITAVLRWFTKSEFYYTLEPPPLGDNRVDEFLFKTRRGFCEHLAEGGSAEAMPCHIGEMAQIEGIFAD